MGAIPEAAQAFGEMLLQTGDPGGAGAREHGRHRQQRQRRDEVGAARDIALVAGFLQLFR